MKRWKFSLPALITVSNELGEPLCPIRGIVAARREEPIIWKPADIGVDAFKVGLAGRRVRMVKIFQPAHVSNCEMNYRSNEEDAGKISRKKWQRMKLL